MSQRQQLLADSGFLLVSVSGEYCRAIRDGRDCILRWDGEHWVMVTR